MTGRVRSLAPFVTRWDVHVFARAALVAALALAMSWVLTAATDEGGVAWGERVGRTLPLTPVCSAIGVWAALAPVKARGEARALQALGRSKAQVGAAAVAGGAFVALIAALSVGLLPSVSVAGFYPTARHSTAWTWDGKAFVDPVRSLRIGEDGTPAPLSKGAASTPAQSRIPRDREAAALATAMIGLAMALLLADSLLGMDRPRFSAARRGDRWLWRPSTAFVAVTAISAGAALVLFQAAAARKAPALLADLPPLALLGLAIRRVWAAP